MSQTFEKESHRGFCLVQRKKTKEPKREVQYKQSRKRLPLVGFNTLYLSNEEELYT